MERKLAQSEAPEYTPTMATVTTTLRTSLEQCGLTRYAVSKATGIPESTLSRFVAGGKPLRGENIDKLATYLGLELVQRSNADSNAGGNRGSTKASNTVSNTGGNARKGR